MGRPKRVDAGGYAYHVLNRFVGKKILLKTDSDFQAFERVLEEAKARSDGEVRLLAYCVMGNHWHLVVKTTRDGALGRFMQWLTLTHTQRYRAAKHSVGSGPLYQGRFKSFLIDPRERHLLTVCRYVERNAARAALVDRAEDWPWSSLHRWRSGDQDLQQLLSRWPVQGNVSPETGRPIQWLRTVNTPLPEAEYEALRAAANRCRPYGGDAWRDKVIARFGLESTVRRPGRPGRAKA